MGMTIEEAIKEIESITVVTDEKQALAFALAVHIMKKYQMIQADYENRLKADLKAILVELQLEIEELDFFEGEEELINITQELMDEVTSWEHGVKDCKKLIQQKIDSLKGENNDDR